jgi:hypothetical protein
MKHNHVSYLVFFDYIHFDGKWEYWRKIEGTPKENMTFIFDVIDFENNNLSFLTCLLQNFLCYYYDYSSSPVFTFCFGKRFLFKMSVTTINFSFFWIHFICLSSCWIMEYVIWHMAHVLVENWNQIFHRLY